MAQWQDFHRPVQSKTFSWAFCWSELFLFYLHSSSLFRLIDDSEIVRGFILFFLINRRFRLIFSLQMLSLLMKLQKCLDKKMSYW